MWLTESIRLTAFTELPNVNADAKWWREVVGQDPATHTVQRTPPALLEHGPIGDGFCNLLLNSQPGRIDWMMSAIIPDARKFDTYPNFGLFDKATAQFRQVGQSWLSLADVPAIKRLAVGVVLVAPVADKDEGYEKIQDFLPYVKVDKNSADLLYQINRPRKSRSIKDLRINRLSQWSVAILSGIQIQIGPGGSSRAIESPSALSAIRLEMDINTQPENVQSFKADVCKSLLEELVEMAQEIAAKGDVS